jgi:hypothetical protein
VKVNWFDVAVASGLTAAGCAAVYGLTVRALRRAIAERQQAADRQLNALATTVKALQWRVAEFGAQETPRAQASEAEAPARAAENPAGEESEPLKPETLAAVSAAATAFLGRRARVRSVRSLPVAPEAVGAWAQQGRMIVQTSHNLRPRR